MRRVGIADLKARLSRYLRMVRLGEIVTVLDRKTPVARLVPYRSDEGVLRVRPPDEGAPKPCEVPLPPPAGLEVDAVELLLEDRGSGR